MRTNRTLEEMKEWLMALERERYDLSYRSAKSDDLSVTEVKPKARARAPKVAETYKTKTSEPTLEELRARTKRDQLFYDAGRYAGGARDQEAVKAFQDLHKGGASWAK